MARMYGGKTAEDRASARRRQCLDAGLEVFGTKGFAAATVRGVCESAGLSTRLFYETFKDLDELAAAVFDEIVEQTFSAVLAAVAGAGTSRGDQSRAAMQTMFAELTDDPRRARVVFVESHGHPVLAERREQVMRRLAETIDLLGREIYPEDRAPDARADELRRVTATLLAGGVVELIIAWLDGRVDQPRERLTEQAALVVRAIGDAASALGPS